MSILEDAKAVTREYEMLKDHLSKLKGYIGNAGDRQYWIAHAVVILNADAILKPIANGRIIEIEKRIAIIEGKQ